jgi:Protein of unknown function (DUF3467)
MIIKKGTHKHNQVRKISDKLRIKEHILNNPQQQKKVNVKIDEVIGEGIYANFMMITHSPSEFILDFGRMMPGMPSVKVKSRILVTPQHAKHFMQLLQKNIENFEKQHGEIKVPGKVEDKDIGFKSTGQNT